MSRHRRPRAAASDRAAAPPDAPSRLVGVSPRGRAEHLDYVTAEMPGELRRWANSLLRRKAKARGLAAERVVTERGTLGRLYVVDTASAVLVSGLTAAELAAWLDTPPTAGGA